ncbi:MAG: 4'-phosphopantetheinyl transferase superfamily protein, partial [Calditrichaeota bacterium]|nr:4'-phosphopantetheinyl transferase superfamily protein [Calditrichota bacterium]
SRFAAKEATYKALNTKRKGITWLDIEVRVTVLGIPSVRLYGNAADESRKQGWNSVSLSLSHDAGIAVAVVNVLKKIDFTL